ncbi:MAG: hypothetical protein WBN11_09645, partial [Eudoraea sp.]
MKTKVSFTFIILGIAIIIYFLLPKADEPQLDPSQQASFYSIKCTVAKYLLEDIDTTRQISPLFENLGDLTFKISTSEEMAQTFFDQGLKLTYAFNHAEAHRSFMEASRIDPTAPMPYWGQAYALGPNINDPLPTTERKEKYNEALKKAQKYMAKASSKEKAMIKALESRYSDDLEKDVAELNMDYMEAMTKVVQEFPN